MVSENTALDLAELGERDYDNLNVVLLAFDGTPRLIRAHHDSVEVVD